jgi:NAD(P)-dependent dehydrogenase (short-subunit alcohol dehydrogenase family)
MRFQDKVVVVTGAAQGIGEAYAKALGAEGAAVVVADLNVESGERVAKEIEAAGGRALFVRTDVSSHESAAELVEATVGEYGGIDGLVNNAAIYGEMAFDLLISVDWDYSAGSCR